VGAIWSGVWLPVDGRAVGQVASDPATVVVDAAADLATRLAAGTWIDLTHPFDDRTIYWPTEMGFLFEAGRNGPTPKGYYYAANRFAASQSRLQNRALFRGAPI
jgi:hypothetical protein